MTGNRFKMSYLPIFFRHQQPHGRRQRGLGGAHQVVAENIFLSCHTSFGPIFLREIDLK